MADIEGKSSPLTVLTPVPPWLRWYRTIVLRIGFWIAPWWNRIFPGSQDLEKLAFIHFARWVLIPTYGFPRLTPEQPLEDLHYDYFLFCSNFNGTWGQYLDAFSDVIPRNVNLLWLGSVKYPKARPLSPFLRYAAYNEFDTDYYYNAYPGASTRDIKAALELYAQLLTFAARTAKLSPGEFQAEYHAFLTRVQDCLGATGVREVKQPADEEFEQPADETSRGGPPPLRREGSHVGLTFVPSGPNGAGNGKE